MAPTKSQQNEKVQISQNLLLKPFSIGLDEIPWHSTLGCRCLDSHLMRCQKFLHLWKVKKNDGQIPLKNTTCPESTFAFYHCIQYCNTVHDLVRRRQSIPKWFDPVSM